MVMKNVEIVKLSPDDWREYKRIRLEALELEPQAFGTTYDEASSKPDEYWRNKLSTIADNIFVFARVGGEIVGTVGAYFEDGQATIVGLYLRKEFRGMGLGKKLVQEIIKEIQVRGIGKVKLDVRPTQKTARALYQSLGFTYASEKETKHQDGEIPELRMEKIIKL